MKGGFPWLVRWAHSAGTRDFYPAFAVLVSTLQKKNFPHRTLFRYFIFCVPIAHQPGQAVVPGRLSLNMCL